MNRITIAGCLAMIFLHGYMGAQLTAFLRAIGANAFQFGVLGALGPMLLGMQFVSALLINRMPSRKQAWIVLLVIRRSAVCLPVLLPWLMPNASPNVMVWTFLVVHGLGLAMGTFSQPIFFGWMGDLLPEKRLTEFWASRQKWLSWTQAGVMLAVASYFFLFRDIDVRITYMLMVFVSAAVGVLDILLFIRIPEPEPQLSDDSLYDRFLAPFREKRFFRLILYTSVMTFGTMMAAPFFALYLLEEIGLPVHSVVLLFTSHAMGGVFFARRVGRLADQTGHRPVIILGSVFKSLIVIAMLLLKPGPVVLILVPVLMFDNMINTALTSSRTGFMLKHSPAANRGMFVAAALAPAGLFGALGSITGGTLIQHLPELHTVFHGVPLTKFRIVFLLSAIMRFAGFLCSHALHEPESETAGVVVSRLYGAVRTRFGLFFGMRR